MMSKDNLNRTESRRKREALVLAAIKEIWKNTGLPATHKQIADQSGIPMGSLPYLLTGLIHDGKIVAEGTRSIRPTKKKLN